MNPVTFLNPAGLFLLLGYIPILILHILKPRRVESIVSSAMLWKADVVAATAARPWSRLRRSWLLLAQLLVVTLLALAWANPVMKKPSPLADHTVVVLDTSASMGAIEGETSRLDVAKEEAANVWQELPSGAKISLVLAGPQPRVLVTATTNQSTFENAVDEVEVAPGPADLAQAMTLAEGLETPEARLGIVLVSDGGHTEQELAGLPLGVTHRPVGSESQNQAITSLTVDPSAEGLGVTVVAEQSRGGPTTVLLTVSVDGDPKRVLDIELQEGQPTITELDVPNGEQVVASISAVSSDDTDSEDSDTPELASASDLLAIDNQAFATARDQRSTTVALVGDPTPFLEAMVAAQQGVEVVDNSKTVADLVIYSGVDVPEDINQPFVAIRPPSGLPGITVDGDIEGPIPTLVANNDSLLAGLDLSSVRIGPSQQVASNGAETLVGAEGAPLLLRGTRNGVPFIYWAFEPADSTLPVDLAFPVLGQRMFQELTRSTTVPPSVTVGTALPVPAGRSSIVRGPDGEETEISPQVGGTTVDTPGLWTISQVDGPSRTVAANVGRQEFLIDPLPVAETSPRPLRPGEELPTTSTSLRWLLILGATALAIWEWLLTRRRLGVPGWQWKSANGLRVVAAILLAGTLIGVAVPLRTNEVATVFVLDRSDSVGRSGQTAGLDAVLAAAEASPGDGKLGVVVSADGSRVEQLLLGADQSSGQATAEVVGSRSDLSSGLRLAGALLPEDARRRVVVVSDGRATSGDTVAEAEALGQRGIPVEFIPLDRVIQADAAVTSVQTPRAVGEGETITIDTTVESSLAQDATAVLIRNDEPVTSKPVSLEAGSNRISFTDTPDTTGLLYYEVRIETNLDDLPQNDVGSSSVEIEGPSQVLIVEGSEGAGFELSQALAAEGLQVDVVKPEDLPPLERLGGYKSTVLVDVSLDSFSPSQQQSLRVATEQLGRGLVTIGGTQSFGLGQYRDSELEEVLPVVSDVLDPTKQPTLAQVMAVDTSGSMAERQAGGPAKIDIVRVAATRAFTSLGPQDEAGLIGTDTQSRWILELQPRPEDGVINDELSELQPNGGTDLSDVIPTAQESLTRSDAGIKHLIVFSDGFTGGDVLREMRRQAEAARAAGITVSVVATGVAAAQDMAPIAAAGGGRFYAVQDLNLLPEILLQETIIASRSFVTEGEFIPTVTGRSPATDGLTETPPLFGYVAATSKGTARTIMRIGDADDPLLVTWQAGLGRSTAWTSDSTNRWSGAWVNWDGYVTFWNQVVRDTFPAETSAAVRATVDDDELRIRAETDGEVTGNKVEATVTGPTGDSQIVELSEVAPGVYEGNTLVEQAGSYAVGVISGVAGEAETVGTDVANFSYASEYRPGSTNTELLEQLSLASNGRGVISPEAAFDTDGLSAGKRSTPLASLLLIVAAILWLVAAFLSRFWFSAKPPIRRRSTSRASTQGQRGRSTSMLRRRRRPLREQADHQDGTPDPPELNEPAESFTESAVTPAPEPEAVGPTAATTFEALLKAKRDNASDDGE